MREIFLFFSVRSSRSPRLFIRQHFFNERHVIARCYRFFNFLFRIIGTLTFTYMIEQQTRLHRLSRILITHRPTYPPLEPRRVTGIKNAYRIAIVTRKPWKECFQLLGREKGPSSTIHSITSFHHFFIFPFVFVKIFCNYFDFVCA